MLIPNNLYITHIPDIALNKSIIPIKNCIYENKSKPYAKGVGIKKIDASSLIALSDLFWFLIKSFMFNKLTTDV